MKFTGIITVPMCIHVFWDEDIKQYKALSTVFKLGRIGPNKEIAEYRLRLAIQAYIEAASINNLSFSTNPKGVLHDEQDKG